MACRSTTSTLLGTLACRGGKLQGRPAAVACLPAECTRAPITTEFRLLEVLDVPTLEGGKAIARPGLFVAPGK